METRLLLLLSKKYRYLNSNWIWGLAVDYWKLCFQSVVELSWNYWFRVHEELWIFFQDSQFCKVVAWILMHSTDHVINFWNFPWRANLNTSALEIFSCLYSVSRENNEIEITLCLPRDLILGSLEVSPTWIPGRSQSF